MMGCPYSHDERSAVLSGDDGACWRVAAAGVPTSDGEFSCYGRVVNEAAAGPPAFSAEQRRLIRETWAKLSPQSTAIGKQVSFWIRTSV